MYNCSNKYWLKPILPIKMGLTVFYMLTITSYERFKFFQVPKKNLTSQKNMSVDRRNPNIINHSVHDHYCTESLFGLLSSLEARAEQFFSILD